MSETEKIIGRIEKKLRKTMLKDRYALLKQLRALKKQLATNGEPVDEQKVGRSLKTLSDKFDASIRQRENRNKNRPSIPSYPDLPVTARKDEIVEAIRNHQVVIISGETGSGKTTQLPKFCLAAGRGISGLIGCTQPRRIAALTVSSRIAEELNEEIGQSVGYKIRFHDKTADSTFIKVMTDGILLAEAQSDRFLNEYDTIIVDEAHERSLNIDFILGILRTLIKKRRDLKVIITSATIDTEKFSTAFDDAPVIEVTGRTFPVDVLYRPQPEGDDELTYVDMAVKGVEEINRFGPYGDILMFMPTEADIRETCELLEGRRHLNATVLPLYARLSAGEQKQIFSSVTGRKIVVATNVAETSITIPGIKYVIDTGLARIPQYTPRTRTTSLPVLPISKSSADQRMGRCGRVENGVCIRLFEETDYHSRQLFTPPEILRANLAEVILRMISLNLGNVESFPFIDPPAPKSIRDGFDTLRELGAIKMSGRSGRKASGQPYQLTNHGRVMARLPVDPKLARMLIEAESQGCLEEVTIIISALSIRDPRERPADKVQHADQMHAVFKDPYSDFVSLLNIWRACHEEVDGSRSLGKLKKFCKKYFLSFLRMREWRDIHYQLTSTLKENGFRNKAVVSNEAVAGKKEVFGPLYTAIHKSVLAGYLSGVAVKKEKNVYQATRGREAMVFPGSGLFNNAGQWIVAAEMVETSRLFARNVANIDNGWLEELGRDNCTYSYRDPHWERKRGAVMAYEQVSLFGLIVVSGRPVQYGPIDPAEATRIFIRSALVEGDVDVSKAGRSLSFLSHNLSLIDEVKTLEDRVRRRDILISEEDMYAFYMERLENVYDIRSLVTLIKQRGGDGFLKMDPDSLYRLSPDESELALFPEKVTISGARYDCNYHFDPGGEKDGVTLTIPTHSVAAVSPEALEWVVPGLVREKIESLIKGLPKEYRKQLVPVTATLDTIISEMPGITSFSNDSALPDTSLIGALGSFIFSRFGVDIPASAWPVSELPHHLKMRISITATDGKEVASGRELSLLADTYSALPDGDQFETAKKRWEKDSVDGWNFGDLPDHIRLPGEPGWVAFPALCPEETGIALRLFKDKRQAVDIHRVGVRALYEKVLSKHLKGLKKDLVLKGQIKHLANYFGGEKAVVTAMYDRVADDLFSGNIRSQEAFESRMNERVPRIYQAGQDLLKLVTEIIQAYHEVRDVIFTQEAAIKPGTAMQEFAESLRRELDHLVPGTFIKLYDADRLSALSRLIKALKIRVERGFVNPEKDRAKAQEIEPHIRMLHSFLGKLTPETPTEVREKVETFFWMIEEYKVSVFAQELKTPVKISAKRLKQFAGEIGRRL